MLDCIRELFGIKNQCSTHLWQTVYVVLLAYSKQTQSDGRIRCRFIKVQNIILNFTGTKMIKMAIKKKKKTHYVLLHFPQMKLTDVCSRG